MEASCKLGRLIAITLVGVNMKMKVDAGKCCDLACYPMCRGYYHEGCLMFDEKICFFAMKLQLMADKTLFFETGVTPTGAWANHFAVELGPKIKTMNYIDEKVH